MSIPIVKTINISKEFSGVRVLNNINVEIFTGEVFGIIGENGAGKSTFVKIISGAYTPTEGEIYFNGKKVEIESTRKARNLGINIIPQEFNLIKDLNVYENIFLGNEYQKNRLFLDKKGMIQKTKELMEELKVHISPTAKIEDLSIAQKQMVEIAKAIAYEAKVVIMDEPTTVLTQKEIDTLFKLIRRLKAQGVTIIYISHKLKEVKEICDRVMVLRDGNIIDIASTEKLTEREMAEKMIGRDLTQIFPEKTVPQDEIVLKVEGVSVGNLLKDISFDLKKGEILGFSGLIGAGRTEVAETIIGIRKKDKGKIYINGKEFHIHSPEDAVKHKIAYLSEDRQGKGIFVDFGMRVNITITSLKNYLKGMFINFKKEIEQSKSYVEKFNIRAASLDVALRYFSGGNQQKVSFAKSLDINPQIFIIDEPTRGIDVNAKREIYYFINQLVKEGISCILISSELEEIIGMCNRVVVMREGKITGVLQGEHINEKEIMYYATGIKGVS